MRIVVDTNIFISAAITPTGLPQQVLDACLTGVTLVWTSSMQREIREVLSKPKVQALHRWSDGEIRRYIKYWSLVAEVLPEPKSVQVSSDPNDDKLFACAVEAQADYIVSGDKKHVLSIPEYQGVKTISPSDFVRNVLKVEKAA